MARSRSTIKDIVVLNVLLVSQALLSSCSSKSGSNASPMIYPKRNMKGCIPPCVFTAPELDDLKEKFDDFRSESFMRYIKFNVSYYDQDGAQLVRNKTIAWLKNSGDPFATLPAGIETMSLGTMRYEPKFNVPLVYNSSTCGQKKLCRDAALYWFVMNEFIQNGTGVVLYKDEKDAKRVCVLKDNKQILDCSQPYHVSWFLDAVIFTNMALVLLCAIYLCPWILVYVPHENVTQSTDVPRLMELSSSYPVALSRLAGCIFTLPSLKSNRWADRFKILACFFLVVPSVVYLELALLYLFTIGDVGEGSFYTLAWKSNPDKDYNMPLLSTDETASSDSPSPPNWHGLLSICCYFIMGLGISLLPRKATRKNICCPVCVLRPVATKDQETDRFLS